MTAKKSLINTLNKILKVLNLTHLKDSAGVNFLIGFGNTGIIPPPIRVWAMGHQT